jgi:protein-S-isoprenylcysteine O-methyltransferase Ste14
VSADSLRLSLGGWLFRHRGWLPALPLAAVVLLARPTAASLAIGLALAGVAEVLRCWAARAIGPASRTRGELPGALAEAGPYRFTRNPLYVANILLYSGLAISSGRWAALVLPLLAVPYYALIVAWEERALEQTHGPVYLAFKARTPRWLPRRVAPRGAVPLATWSRALRAERGSLLAIALIVMGLLARFAASGL